MADICLGAVKAGRAPRGQGHGPIKSGRVEPAVLCGACDDKSGIEPVDHESRITPRGLEQQPKPSLVVGRIGK